MAARKQGKQSKQVKPKLAEGGFLKRFGNTVRDSFYTVGDIGLGMVGMTDVIQADDYKTKFSQKFDKVTKAVSPIAGQVLGAAVGIPPQATAALQGIGGAVNNNKLARQGQNELNGQIAMQQQAALDLQNRQRTVSPVGMMPTMGVSSTGYYAKGGGIGGQYEVEKGEVVQGQGVVLEEGSQLASDIHAVEGNKHAAGGTQGQGGERVFSDQLKPAGSKLTYAQIAEKLGKHKGKHESKLTSLDMLGKNSGTRMLGRIEAGLDKLFTEQEMNKQGTDVGVQMGVPQMGGGGRVPKKTGTYSTANHVAPKPGTDLNATAKYLQQFNQDPRGLQELYGYGIDDLDDPINPGQKINYQTLKARSSNKDEYQRMLNSDAYKQGNYKKYDDYVQEQFTNGRQRLLDRAKANPQELVFNPTAVETVNSLRGQNFMRESEFVNDPLKKHFADSRRGTIAVAPGATLKLAKGGRIIDDVASGMDINGLPKSSAAVAGGVDMAGAMGKAGQYGQMALPYIDNVVNALLPVPELKAPMLTEAPRLNTTVDINPQIGQVNQQLRATQQGIDGSTNNAAVARANKVAAMVGTQGILGQLYAGKQQAESGLQNQQMSLNMQTNMSNAAATNQYRQQQYGAQVQRNEDLSANAANASMDAQGQLRDSKLREADVQKMKILAPIFTRTGVLARKEAQQLRDSFGLDNAAQMLNITPAQLQQRLSTVE